MKTYRIPVERIKISDDWKTAVVTITPHDQPMIEAESRTVLKLGPVDPWSVGIVKQDCVKLLPNDRAVMHAITSHGDCVQWIAGGSASPELKKITSDQFGIFQP